jgi:stage II sporulation protein E
MVLPDRIFRAAGAALRPGGGEDGARRAGRYVRRNLEATAAAFRELYESMRDSFRKENGNMSDVSSVFDRAAGRVCRRCALRDACWQRDYITTFNALNDASPAMMERGRGLPEDFPPHFSARCIHFAEFLAAANEELTAYLCRRQYRSRLGESRQAVCRQYAEVGRILSRAANDLGEALPSDPAREKKLRGHLAALGLEGPAAVYYDENGRLRVETEKSPLLSSGEEAGKLSALLGITLRSPEETGETLVFTQAEPLMAVAGVAARKRDGETVSGDAGAWFRKEDGTLYILLCDGMGSGEEANRDSTLTVRLLERFLKAGMEPDQALRVLNSALALRGEAEGGFTTIDLLEVDLFSGEGALYKFGAAPTYVRRKDTVCRYTGSALPAGLVTGAAVRPDVIRLHLEEGDCVLLLSDGVTAGTEDAWLREELKKFCGDSPKDLARSLIDLSSEKSRAADDRTAIAVKLLPRREVKAAARPAGGETAAGNV